MKKVIFCAVALIIGVVGLAQTTPEAPTAPSNAKLLTPLGSAPATANMGKSIQNGNSNKVSVRQIGTSQGAYTMQDDGTGSGGNQARILQTGNVSGGLSGEGNMAELHQKGTENQSTQYQYGDFNESKVNQGLSNTASKQNRALVQQGDTGAQQGQKNKAQIDQDGDNNQARTNQRYDKNQALTQQLGNDNYADIEQIANPDNSIGHTAEVDQIGNLNDAWVRQNGNGARNEATTYQDGDNNFSFQTQFSSAVSGLGNNAVVSQGRNNVLNTVAYQLWWDLEGVDDIMNSPFNLGRADNSVAFQFQSGDDNIAAALQYSADNYAEQWQQGNGNHAYSDQNDFGAPSGGGNYAKQDQSGDNNEAGIAQNGSNHRSFQTQIGNKNKALSTQRGLDNDVNIHQRGDQNYATSAQRGQCNDILIVQYSGQSYSVEQNLSDDLPNGNNTANIFQSGPGGGAIIDCGFDPKLPTTPRVDIPVFDIPDICPGC